MNVQLTDLDKKKLCCEEVWRPIPSYEGCYEASTWGRIKSLARLRKTRKYNGRSSLCPVKEKILVGQMSKTGRTVLLYKDGQRHIFSPCYLVLLTFVGPRPEGMDVCHFPDKNRLNNRLDNLRWDTRSANCMDRRAHGTDPTGERNPNAKLTPVAVAEVRALYASGQYSQQSLGDRFGVHQAHISLIVRGQSWRHVTKE